MAPRSLLPVHCVASWRMRAVSKRRAPRLPDVARALRCAAARPGCAVVAGGVQQRQGDRARAAPDGVPYQRQLGGHLRPLPLHRAADDCGQGPAPAVDAGLGPRGHHTPTSDDEVLKRHTMLFSWAPRSRPGCGLRSPECQCRPCWRRWRLSSHGRLPSIAPCWKPRAMPFRPRREPSMGGIPGFVRA